MTPTPQIITTPPRTKTMSRRLLALGAAAAVALSAGACSTTSGKKADAKSEVGSPLVSDSSGSSPSSQSSGSPPSSGTDSGPGDPSTTTTPSGGTGDDTAVIATSKGAHPADPNDSTSVPLRLDIHSLKRLSGETIEVRFTVTNTGSAGDATFSPYSRLGDAKMSRLKAQYDVGGMALLDRPHDKKYLTLFGTDEICLCTDLNNLELPPGESMSMYADVTAPPESVTKVDLTLPGFAPITGLKIR